MRTAVVTGALLAVIVAGCGGAASPASASPAGTPLGGSISVLAASSLTDAFKRAGDELKRANPGTEVAFSFASSSTLAAQITNGAPADVFASADDTNMQKIVDAKLAEGTPTFFAGNRLRIAVAPGNPKRVTSLADLGRPGLVVVLAGPTVPAGKYALDALAKAGVTVAPASLEVDVRSVLNKVATGEADAGIVYVTDVLSARARVAGIEIPEEHQVVARYPAAVVGGTKNPALARAFVEYLVSDDGQKILASFGFSKP